MSGNNEQNGSRAEENLTTRGIPAEGDIAEQPEVEADSSVVTEDGDLAIAGGKLPGNHDDFEGELQHEIHPVPGAEKKHHPAHAMNKGETKHLGI